MRHYIDVPLSVTLEKDLTKRKDRAVAYHQIPKWVQPAFVRKIRNLNCFELVREWLLEGIAGPEVARRVHEQCGEALDMSRNYLNDCISHYRQTIPPWAFVARINPQKYLKTLRSADEGLDVVKEIQDLYKLQKKRVEIGFQREQQFGLLSSGMEKNMLVAAELIEKLVSLKEQLGLNVEQIPENLNPNIAKDVDWKRVYARESVSKVLENPESRSRVVQVAERLIDMYGPKLVDARVEAWKKADNVAEDPRIKMRAQVQMGQEGATLEVGGLNEETQRDDGHA